jgi:periplasmic protein CpxP/Spy
MFRTGRLVWTMGALLSMGALAAGGASIGAQDGPGMGAGEGMGMHRPPMERALGPMGAHGRWWNNPEVSEKLKLTEDQRKAMDQILLSHREKLVDLRGGLEKAELQMEPLMQADQPNEGQILSQIDKVAQARAELEKANARFLLALRAKLSAEQWKQLQTMRTERRDFRHEGRDGMRRPGMRGMPPPAGSGPGAPGAGAPGTPAPGPQGMLIQPFGPEFEAEFLLVPENGTAN